MQQRFGWLDGTTYFKHVQTMQWRHVAVASFSSGRVSFVVSHMQLLRVSRFLLQGKAPEGRKSGD